jgi:hypothetical protein
MTRALQRTGERLLSLFLPKVEAGACIPEHGQCCTSHCHRRYNCTGGCTVVSSTCHGGC